jgi:2-polyprenyl-3-methyl-5-hydroxy-6-metoxy-1,4-benzoquinol methylase
VAAAGVRTVGGTRPVCGTNCTDSRPPSLLRYYHEIVENESITASAVKSNKSYSEWLASEREFADQAYQDQLNDLAIAPHMLRRYQNPVEGWDFRQVMAKELGDIRGKQVLDYGCGPGEESMYLASLGAIVTSIDISPVGIEVAKRRSDFNKLPIKALVADCLHSGLPSETFDAVHCLGVIHHVGLERGLAEVHRLLKPGGRLVVAEHVSMSPLIEALRNRFGSDKTSEDEGPVPFKDFIEVPVKLGFRIDRRFHYAITYRLRAAFPVLAKPFFQKFDHAMLTLIPPMKRLSACAVLAMTKS